MLNPLQRAARALEHSVHLQTALDTLVADGVGLLHSIEETEHEKMAIKNGLYRRRRARKRH